MYRGLQYITISVLSKNVRVRYRIAGSVTTIQAEKQVFRSVTTPPRYGGGEYDNCDRCCLEGEFNIIINDNAGFRAIELYVAGMFVIFLVPQAAIPAGHTAGTP